MASANFRLGYSSVGTSGPWTWGGYGEAIDVVADDYVKVELESTAGVATINVTIPRADEVTLAAGVPVVTIDQVTRTATFQVGTEAATYCVEVTANPSSTSAVVAALAVHIPMMNGMRLLALDETTESDATYKWLGKVNDVVRSNGLVEVNDNDGYQIGFCDVAASPQGRPSLSSSSTADDIAQALAAIGLATYTP